MKTPDVIIIAALIKADVVKVDPLIGVQLEEIQVVIPYFRESKWNPYMFYRIYRNTIKSFELIKI